MRESPLKPTPGLSGPPATSDRAPSNFSTGHSPLSPISLAWFMLESCILHVERLVKPPMNHAPAEMNPANDLVRDCAEVTFAVQARTMGSGADRIFELREDAA